MGLVLVAVLALGCKKKQAADTGAGSAATGNGTSGSGSAAGSAEPSEPPPPPVAPRTPLPAGTIVDQPGTALDKPKTIAIGDVVDGEVREAEDGKDPPANEHYYRFEAKPGDKLKIEWAVRSSDSGGFAVATVVMDDAENIVVPEKQAFTDQQGWTRTDWDSALPPIAVAKPLIVKISPDDLYACCGRYRFRIVK